MTPWQEIAEAMRPLSRVIDLTRLWQDQSVQMKLKAMTPAERNTLIAMKDFYKGMMIRGEIEHYHKVRCKCAIDSAASPK